MKLSKRERRLLIIFLLAVVVYLVYNFVPFDRFLKLEALREQYNETSEAYNNMSQNIALKNQYEKNLKERLEAARQVSAVSDLQQEKLINFIDKYSVNNGINISNINFTEKAVKPMSNLSETEAAESVNSSLDLIVNDYNSIENMPQDIVQNVENKQAGSMTVQSVTVGMNFESSYDNLMKFIDAINDNLVDISITNINILSSGGDILQGNMTLNFYELPRPEGYIEENEDWIWKDLAVFGKQNPFSSDAGAALSASTGSFDFSMSVMPDSSDLPTLIVGRTDDSNRVSYLYADSNAVENVNFDFKTENSKYYYKYETSKGKYPADGTWKEFVPVSTGNVYIKVFSSERNSKADSAGVNVGVNNTSGLKVRFQVEGDDKTNSRVYFKDPKSVIVTRK